MKSFVGKMSKRKQRSRAAASVRKFDEMIITVLKSKIIDEGKSNPSKSKFI